MKFPQNYDGTTGERLNEYASPGTQLQRTSRAGTIRLYGLGGVAVLACVMLVAGLMSFTPFPTQAQNSSVQNIPNSALAQELARTYREIAKTTFPGIVAIETQGRMAQARRQGQEIDPGERFGDDPRLEEFFRNMPEFRRFFEQPRQQAPRQQAPRRVPRGQGSGFVIDREGHILTNNHVVSNAEVVKVRLYDDREFIAEIVGVDPRSDVAVIKIDAPNLEPVKLGDSDDMAVGDIVLAFGSPFGLEKTMTQGIISATSRGPGINEREDYLQTDAAINPGNSGGPLVNLKGEVIGINTAISSRSGGYEGVGFAIPINMASWAADQILATGKVKRAYIGVLIQAITNDLAEQLGVGVNQGAIVTQVMPDSPADNAGLQPGDVIKELDGKTVAGTRQLQGIVERLKIGKDYTLLIQRDRKEKKLKIAMAEMPDRITLAGRGEPEEEEATEETEAVTNKDLGVQIQNLSGELAEQLGYSDRVQGVVITSVESDSLAEQNGLREGEVIERVNQTRVTSVEEFNAAMKSVDLEKGLLLLVRRGEATRFLAIKKR